jgi:hypothetical protein
MIRDPFHTRFRIVSRADRLNAMCQQTVTSRPKKPKPWKWEALNLLYHLTLLGFDAQGGAKPLPERISVWDIWEGGSTDYLPT